MSGSLIPAAGGVGIEHTSHLISDAAENGELLLLRARGVSRIIKAPVVTMRLSGEHRTGLVGVSTDRDDGFYRVPEEFLQRLRAMGGNVDTDLLHHRDGFGVHVTGGFRAGAFHRDEITDGVS